MKIIITTLILCSLMQSAFVKAQGIGINTDGSTADSKAILDVKSTTRGFLPPRLNASQRDALSSNLTAAQTGLRVSDSSTGQLYYWNGTAWNNPAEISATYPLVINTATNSIALNAGTQPGDLITWDGNNWVNLQPAQQFSITTDNMQPYLVVNYFIAEYGIFPSQNDVTPFVGQICISGFNFAPVGFLPCNGSLQSISNSTVLFTLLGTTYGGDGVTTFAVPDLRGRAPLHLGQGVGFSNYFLGQTAGSETSLIAH